MARSMARSWTIVCLLLTLVAVGLTAWSWPARAVASDGHSEEPVVAGGGSTDREAGVRVASVVGDVEVRSPGGAWAPLAPGVRLSQGTEVRTGAFSEGVLRDAGGSTISITPNTTFTIGNDASDTSRFTLESGKVAADIRRERKRAYEFSAGTGDAVADTTGGEFSLVADGEGLLGVVTRKGTVGLSAKGKRVEVGAGKQAVALPGTAPTDPLPIPDSVLLQVQWPTAPTTKRRIEVAGTADPGSRLRVDGKLVQVDPTGKFATQMQLKQGENHFVIVAEDMSGRTIKEQSPAIVRTLKKPTLQVDTDGSIWE